GRRQQARDARDRRDDPRAAVRQHRRSREGPDRHRRVHVASVSRRSDQRRAAAFALYEHAVTGKELDDVFERDASEFTRALAYAAQDYGDDLDELIARHAQGWALDRIAPLERAIMEIALVEMLHPD